MEIFACKINNQDIFKGQNDNFLRQFCNVALLLIFLALNVFIRASEIRLDLFCLVMWVFLTLFREGGKKPPPTSFSSVTSANVRISSQNFLTFSFNLFATLVQNFKFAPSASLKLLNLNQDHPSKKAIFLVKSL